MKELANDMAVLIMTLTIVCGVGMIVVLCINQYYINKSWNDIMNRHKKKCDLKS